MTIPLLLCTLIAVTSGLHFGRGFLQAHLRGGNLLIPALAHMAVSAALMVLSVLLDESQTGMMWMIVATGSMAGLALGALLPVRPLVTAPAEAQPESVVLPTAQAA
ncbi:hypothetical protein [Deinococcus koreensis]|uniref:Uncharacterized protein n=1 Tax=Deinococcus koreensis TaxID=2054903 RepID=A0A2K3UWJ9_9DEIO|nr:hypothetical protein [Deinococcus koreensis]PNY80905.1 hypothetical protein CVO96_05555 [Deinococcus koreensis]